MFVLRSCTDYICQSVYLFQINFLILFAIWCNCPVQIAQDIGTEAKSQQDFLDQLVCNCFLNTVHSYHISTCVLYFEFNSWFLLIDDRACERKKKFQVMIT